MTLLSLYREIQNWAPSALKKRDFFSTRLTVSWSPFRTILRLSLQASPGQDL